MEASTLFRALKPFNSYLTKSTKSIPIRCSSIPSISTIHTGKEGKVKRAYDGLLLDAGGTLLQLAKPVEETYLTIDRKYGLQSTAADIKQGFKRAFSAPWPEKLQYQIWVSLNAAIYVDSRDAMWLESTVGTSATATCLFPGAYNDIKSCTKLKAKYPKYRRCFGNYHKPQGVLR